LEKPMATLRAKAGKPPLQPKRPKATPPAPQPEPEPEPEPELQEELGAAVGATDADLLAAATMGDLDALTRLLATPPPAAHPRQPQPEPEPEPQPQPQPEPEPEPEPEPQPEPEPELELELELEPEPAQALEVAGAGATDAPATPLLPQADMVDLLAAAAASGDVAELTRLLATPPPQPSSSTHTPPPAASDGGAKRAEEGDPPPQSPTETVPNTAVGEEDRLEVAEAPPPPPLELPPSEPVVDAAINLLISSGALQQPAAAAALLTLSPITPRHNSSTVEEENPSDSGGQALQQDEVNYPAAADPAAPVEVEAVALADAIEQCKAAANGCDETEMDAALATATAALTAHTHATAEATHEGGGEGGELAELRAQSAALTERLARLRGALRLLEQAERDASDAQDGGASIIGGVSSATTMAAVAAACKGWPHLEGRLAKLSRDTSRADQKRTRREARIRRSIASAKRSGEPASIQVAAAAATAAGLAQEAAALRAYGKALEEARKLIRRANKTKDLADIQRARAEAEQYECLRRSQQFSDLQSMAASSPGPGQYAAHTPRGSSHGGDPPRGVDASPGVSWDASGVWAWKERKVRDGNGGVVSQFVRVQCANAKANGSSAAGNGNADSSGLLDESSGALGPGTYDDVSPAVYMSGVGRSHSQAAASPSFSAEGRQAISDRHDEHHASRPGPGDYASTGHTMAFDPALPENSQLDPGFHATPREALQEREERWRAAASPLSECYELRASSAFGEVSSVVPGGEGGGGGEQSLNSTGHAVFKEVVVNGAKGWARVERS
jgi:hypothetical protein